MLRSLSALLAVSCCCVSAAAGRGGGGGGGGGDELSAEPSLLHAAGENLLRYVVASDDAWAVIVVESPAQTDCGAPCEEIRALLARVARSSPALRLAYLFPQDQVVGADGESVPAHALYNITTVPSVALYSAGAKTPRSALLLEAQLAGSIFSRGAKALHEALASFAAPGLVAPVRAATLADWLARPSTAAGLPRVLFLAKQQQQPPPLTLRRLSLDFAARAVFGAAAGDAALAAAFEVDAAAPGFTSAFLLGPAAATEAAAAPLKRGAYGAAAGWARFGGAALTYERLYEWLDAALPRAPLPQLRSQEDWDRVCGRAPDATICVIAVLPHEAEAAAAARAAEEPEPPQTCADGDAECDRSRRRLHGFDGSGGGGDGEEEDEDDEDAGDRDGGAAGRARAARRVLAALHKLADRALIRTDWSSIGSASGLRAERLPLAPLAWVDAAEQPELAAALRAPPPGLVALNPRKHKLAVMRGALSPRAAHDFVASLLADAQAAGGGAEERAARAAAVAFEDVGELPPLRAQPPLAPPRARAAKGKGGKAKGGKKAGKAAKKASKKKGGKKAAAAAAAAEAEAAAAPPADAEEREL